MNDKDDLLEAMSAFVLHVEALELQDTDDVEMAMRMRAHFKNMLDTLTTKLINNRDYMTLETRLRLINTIKNEKPPRHTKYVGGLKLSDIQLRHV